MASSTKNPNLLIISLILLSSIHRPTHARDNQLFNKVAASTTVSTGQQPRNGQKQEQQSKFLLQKSNDGYGIYRHVSAESHRAFPAHEPEEEDDIEANDVYYNHDPSGEYSEIGNNGRSADSRFNRNVPQGMSDTRYVEGGKYFYDLQSESFGRNHLYNRRNNYDGGHESNGDGNSVAGYNIPFEFQGEVDNNLP